ncbi:AAA family ATPase [Chitinophaga terrae (ex Kim and Jung 2007)]|nr:AAA family ATPase [Chitinophaga terrae (ex Kim and Jung 2007)]
MDEVVAICKSYQELLTDHIEKIQQKLDKLNTNKKLVKTISLKYDFDYSAAWEQIIRDFQRLFEPAIRQFTVKAKFDSQPLEQLLFHIKNMDDPSHDKYLEVLEADPTRSNAKTFLKELFSDPSNFELFKLIIKHALHDYFTYKKILVYYDGKSIDIASFGQRCTAALVILLLLGNNPIIIDEPEAHLDSMLISNYLVEVIKTRKNERQIIFATHNANFVINGDAELIHILEVDDHTNLTIIKSTTIENDATRDNLVALEGGHEAFQKREHRYSNTLKA